MNFVNTTQAYGRPISNINVRQQLHARDCFDLPGGVVLWKCAGRIALIVGLFVVCANLMFGSFVDSVDETISAAERTQREFMTKYQILNDYKKELWSKENIANLAGKKLALHAPVDGQVKYL